MNKTKSNVLKNARRASYPLYITTKPSGLAGKKKKASFFSKKTLNQKKRKRQAKKYYLKNKERLKEAQKIYYHNTKKENYLKGEAPITKKQAMLGKRNKESKGTIPFSHSCLYCSKKIKGSILFCVKCVERISFNKRLEALCKYERKRFSRYNARGNKK
jgi:hypothetical protein